jgi:hypothetical protein
VDLHPCRALPARAIAGGPVSYKCVDVVFSLASPRCTQFDMSCNPFRCASMTCKSSRCSQGNVQPHSATSPPMQVDNGQLGCANSTKVRRQSTNPASCALFRCTAVCWDAGCCMRAPPSDLLRAACCHSLQGLKTYCGTLATRLCMFCVLWWEINVCSCCTPHGWHAVLLFLSLPCTYYTLRFVHLQCLHAQPCMCTPRLAIAQS